MGDKRRSRSSTRSMSLIKDVNKKSRPFSYTTQESRGGYTQAQQDLYSQHLKKLKNEFQEIWNHNPNALATLVDFERLKILGTGAFGTVYLVRHKKKETFHAMKMLEKEKIVKLKQIDHSLYEKKILCSINFPFVVRMDYFSKDNVYLYFILPFVVGGEMFTHLRKAGKFDESTAKFYAGQVILALEYLHSCDLVYRDLKPENILIEKTGYLKITDFGFCKILRGRTWTLCGTPEYLAPEVILSRGYGTSVDWWSLGILIYEMSAGHPPFYASDPMRIYERIVSGKYRVPGHFSVELRDLIKNTVQVDVTKRFGVLKDGTLDFKNHRWFKEVDWDTMLNCKMAAPFVPKFKSAGDTSNFDHYDEEKIKENQACLYEAEFADF